MGEVRKEKKFEARPGCTVRSILKGHRKTKKEVRGETRGRNERRGEEEKVKHRGKLWGAVLHEYGDY